MSRSSILEALTDEQKSLDAQVAELERQRDGIARAIEALQSAGGSGAAGGRGRKKAVKKVVRKRRAMTEEQRQAVSERMKKYWASRREQG